MSFYCADTSERFLPPPPARRPRGGLNSVSYQLYGNLPGELRGGGRASPKGGLLIPLNILGIVPLWRLIFHNPFSHHDRSWGLQHIVLPPPPLGHPPH